MQSDETLGKESSHRNSFILMHPKSKMVYGLTLLLVCEPPKVMRSLILAFERENFTMLDNNVAEVLCRNNNLIPCS